MRKHGLNAWTTKVAPVVLAAALNIATGLIEVENTLRWWVGLASVVLVTATLFLLGKAERAEREQERLERERAETERYERERAEREQERLERERPRRNATSASGPNVSRSGWR